MSRRALSVVPAINMAEPLSVCLAMEINLSSAKLLGHAILCMSTADDMPQAATGQVASELVAYIEDLETRWKALLELLREPKRR
jgi:hypothetical protein